MKYYSQTIALVAFLLIASSCRLNAQWTQIGQFPNPINSAYFWDASNGIIGSGHTCISNPIAIWRTSDAGKTWIPSTVPTGYLGSVSQICMVGRDTGWASILPWSSTKNVRLWKTVDAGATWSEVGQNGTGDGVYATSKVLIETDLDPNVKGGISTDGGKTFSNIWPGRTTGIDFTDSLHGIVTVFREGTWQATTDAGVSWHALSMTDEAWSIYAVKGTNTYYTCGESYSPATTICKRTTDQGKTWTTQSVLGFQTSGHVAGIGEDVLYIQTVNESPHPSGVLRSTDQGKTWVDIGGPRNWFDSRFWLLGCGSARVLYAFDEVGGVFRHTEGAADSAILQFKILPTQQAIEGDCMTSIHVVPMQSLPSGALTSFAFDLVYDTDLLTEISLPPISGVTVTETPITGGRHYVIHPGSVQLDSGVALLEVVYRTAASNHSSTSMRMTNLFVQMNGDQSSPCAAIPSAIGDSIYLRGCQADMLAKFMATGDFSISSVSPVPAHTGEAVTLQMFSPIPASTQWQVLDVLGHSVLRGATVAFEGEQKIRIPAGQLVPGSYIVRVTSERGEVKSARLLIE